MVIEKVVIVRNSDGTERNYTYKITKQGEGSINEYGIIATKEEILNGSIMDTMKSELRCISSNQEKVIEIMNLLSRNEVSPIHLKDVVADYIEYAC